MVERRGYQETVKDRFGSVLGQGGERRMEKLAIKGGIPVRDNKIYYGHQWIDEADINAVCDVLRGDFLTCGPKVLEMERILCEYTGAKYAAAVSNGTAALHCACIAAGIGPGDEVITSPLTFAASANCVLYCNARPVFADVDPATYNIDPESIRTHITEHTKAVIAVDFTGQAVRHDEIRAICDEFGLIFIEDAAHGIATQYNGKQVGSLADMTCFSFHPVKTITGGEGGAILTNKKEYYEKLRLVRTHGITHDKCEVRADLQEGPWCYDQIFAGYNYRITDFQAALIISQMKKLDAFAARRKEIANIYDKAFAQIPEIILQKRISETNTCPHLYIIRLKLDSLTCTRREFFDAMSAENVQCQVHYIPVYWFTHYQHLGYEKGMCKYAEEIYQSIMSIPLYPRMSEEDVEDVIHAITKVIENYRKK